jgi:hypothetical protein
MKKKRGSKIIRNLYLNSQEEIFSFFAAPETSHAMHVGGGRDRIRTYDLLGVNQML